MDKQLEFLKEFQELCKKYDTYIQHRENFVYIYTNNGRGRDESIFKHINSEYLI